jgi:hypothetical protein
VRFPKDGLAKEMPTRGEAAQQLRRALQKVYSDHYEIYFRPNFNHAGRLHRATPFEASDQIRNAFDHLLEPIALLNALLDSPVGDVDEDAFAQALLQIARCKRHVEIGTYESLVSQMEARLPALKELIELIEGEYNVSLKTERDRYAAIARRFDTRTRPPTGPAGADIEQALKAVISASNELTEWLNGLDNMYINLLGQHPRVRALIVARGV